MCDSQPSGGWERYLPWRKERQPQRVCFQASGVSLLRCQTSRPAPRASILGQSSPAHEEAGCRSVSEGAGCHTVVTWSRAPCTSNGPQERSGGLPSCFRNSKAGSKARSVRRKKTATGCILKQLLCRPVFRLLGRKLRILAPSPSIQLGAQGLFPTGSEKHTLCGCLSFLPHSQRFLNQGGSPPLLACGLLEVQVALDLMTTAWHLAPHTHSRSLLPHGQGRADLGTRLQGSENTGRHTALTLELRPSEQDWRSV